MSTWNGDPTYYMTTTAAAAPNPNDYVVVYSGVGGATAANPTFKIETGTAVIPANIIAGQGICASKTCQGDYLISSDTTKIDDLSKTVKELKEKIDNLKIESFLNQAKAFVSIRRMCELLGYNYEDIVNYVRRDDDDDLPLPKKPKKSEISTGYKGKETLDIGYFYAPYVPLSGWVESREDAYDRAMKILDV